jgi:5-methylcytosine-specific restriction endonuclease McrA
MKFRQVDRLADHFVLPGLGSVVAQGCANTAKMLAYIAVADERKLYLPAAYPSMYQYCLGELHMSQDAAAKRIQAARAARKFPAIFDAVEQGRLHLAPENATELIAAVTHKSSAEVRLLLAERFPQPDLATLVQPIMPVGVTGPVVQEDVCDSGEKHAPEHVDDHTRHAVSEPVGPIVPRTQLTPLAPERFALQVTIPQATHDKLRHAQALLGHAVPSGDVAEVLDRALDALIRQLEQRKFAATNRPRTCQARRTASPRHVPAAVQRTVWERDGSQCTFVSEKGHRCEARSRLEFDHVVPVARGGQTTEQNLRLRCRPHNQHEAERTFGRGFMEAKRHEARREAVEAKEQKATAVAARVRARAAEEAELAAAADVIPGLRILGCRADELRLAAALCAAIPDAPTAERMLCALRGLGRAGMRRSAHVTTSPN